MYGSGAAEGSGCAAPPDKTMKKVKEELICGQKEMYMF